MQTKNARLLTDDDKVLHRGPLAQSAVPFWSTTADDTGCRESVSIISRAANHLSNDEYAKQLLTILRPRLSEEGRKVCAKDIWLCEVTQRTRHDTQGDDTKMRRRKNRQVFLR